MHGKHRRVGSAWLKRSIVAVIILGLGASSLYFYSQSREIHHAAGTDPPPQLAAGNTAKRPQQSTPSSAKDRIVKATPRKPPVPVQKPGRQVRPSEIDKRAPTTPGRFRSPPASKKPGAESSSMVQRPPISSAEDVFTDENRTNGPTRDAAQRATARTSAPGSSGIKSSPPTQSAAKPVKKKPARAPVESYQNVSVLTDGRLKVQAIVWSRIPEDRMTVINSRVLHEGDTVDGFTLVVIRPDDVVVKESGGGRWKVIFGRP